MTQVAVITGAADGLGKAFATRFAEAGYQVVAADINDAAGEALVAALNPPPLPPLSSPPR